MISYFMKGPPPPPAHHGAAVTHQQRQADIDHRDRDLSSSCSPAFLLHQ